MKYQSKWRVIGIKRIELKKIYSRNRGRANSILKNRHLKEYSLILNNLMNKEYNKRSKKWKH